MTNCDHDWNKESGIKKQGKPWVGIPSRYERKCRKCGLEQRFTKDFSGIGWSDIISYLGKKNNVSNCCETSIIENTDICSRCKEHCEPETLI